MPRTTSTAVKSILAASGVPADIVLDPWIETANAIVSAKCTASGYSDATLELIERWLSAHFYVLDDPRIVDEGIASGPHQQREFFKVDIGLDNTKYGQTAKRLDFEGNLAAFENTLKTVKTSLAPGGSPSAGTKWLGTACGGRR